MGDTGLGGKKQEFGSLCVPEQVIVLTCKMRVVDQMIP